MISDSNLIDIDVIKIIEEFEGKVDASLEGEFLILDLKGKDVVDIPILRYPVRINGYVALFCQEGNLSIEVNLSKYEMHQNNLLVIVPGNIIRLDTLSSPVEDIHFIVMISTKEFLQDMRFDFNRLFNESVYLLSNPCITLDGENLELSIKYIELITKIVNNKEISNRKEAVSSLASSLFYILAGIWLDKLRKTKQETSGQSTRAKMIFTQFMRLVTEYHFKERNMAFYAEKLFLTPKYLSKLVKQVSGRSAPEWIDEYVILEAKNMLKYSSLSIKEIMYKLNFPNQSVFYKFFKSHTGMTPSEYRAG